MKDVGGGALSSLLDMLSSFLRKCIFNVLSIGPIPNHIAFIMDGNRRFTKKRNMEEGSGYDAGFLALMSMLKYCFEFGIKYVSVYAFSIDNFKRRPEEVKILMELMQEKIEGLIREESFLNQLGIRVYFIGNLKLLSGSVRGAANRAMEATAGNSRAVLCICIAYTSTDEIVNAVERSCCKKSYGNYMGPNNIHFGSTGFELGVSNHQQCIELADIEEHMYMAVATEPEILIRTSGEKRLSNFLLWQSAHSYMYAPSVYWPEIGFRHLLWAILNFQHHFSYLEKKKKQH